MLITPTVNYRDLLRRVLGELDAMHVQTMVEDAFTYSEEERKILEELNDSFVQDAG